MSQAVRFDRELIEKYNRAGPRYTSYPTAPHFTEAFGPERFLQEVEFTNRQANPRPLSLYVHIPFCDTVCHYCACNRIVTPDRRKAVTYLDYLFREVERMGALFDRSRPVVQMHFGGGTPTYLDAGQLERCLEVIGRHFTLLSGDAGEYGIEVDPREVPPGTLTAVRRMGFNRLSIGVQDLDPRVQKAVNRIQPLEVTQAAVDEAKAAGFLSLNLDLIYGLPFQTEASFRHTVEEVVKRFDPDRLAVFNYAHLPQYFPPQRRINTQELPSAEEKLRMMETTINVLLAAGYVYVGMDHFAKPGDELAVAQRDGVLHRNFQGYTTHGECDLIALGITGISQIGEIYAQNLKELEPYYQRLDEGGIPVFRGLVLSRDDLVRRHVIMRLMCDFQLDRHSLEHQFGIDFAGYFSAEEQEIARMVQEGLLEDDGRILRVTPGGRLLIRNVCMAFDWYLRHAEQKKSFSRTI
ncbi:MAG: oxygen-independent coproporphyrinogen III oxidase [Magnetococcales bacterium]|nr:oxygen-independent coproporphyrinogen III oxidase [Magnetococcales bacterium]